MKLWLKLKKSNLVRLIKSKSIIKELNDKIETLEKEKQKLNDKVGKLDIENKELEKEANRVPSLELIIEGADKSIKEKLIENKELEEKRLELETKLFETNQELASVKIQLEEYKTEGRYLIKKVKSGRPPNTIKTKISKPMSSRVTKYMRGEHE